MVSRSRELLQYWESSDPRVALAGIEVRTGRKWRAAEAVEITVSRLQQRVVQWPREEWAWVAVENLTTTRHRGKIGGR